ncbi:MAG TPA: hypothetical protein VKA97_05245 [Pyrinomonadaceae bacterium]|nr:hypothetical protein [Pyrinomonadaceae bacterium]
MVTLLLTSVLILGLVAIAVYYWQKPAKSSQTIDLPLPQSRGLFSDFRVNQLRVPTDELPAEPKVDSEAFDDAIQAIRAFQQSPDRSSTTKLLRIAALTDDAKNYGRAIELVLMSWRDGSLADLSAVELQALINSEYWVLSSNTRSSGAGFVLKRTLSTANSELQPTNNP